MLHHQSVQIDGKHVAVAGKLLLLIVGHRRFAIRHFGRHRQQVVLHQSRQLDNVLVQLPRMRRRTDQLFVTRILDPTESRHQQSHRSLDSRHLRIDELEWANHRIV